MRLFRIGSWQISDSGSCAGLTLEEMDEVFGASEGLAAADQARQDAILRRLGLLDDGGGKKDEESGKGSHDEKAEPEKTEG